MKHELARRIGEALCIHYLHPLSRVKLYSMFTCIFRTSSACWRVVMGLYRAADTSLVKRAEAEGAESACPAVWGRLVYGMAPQVVAGL